MAAWCSGLEGHRCHRLRIHDAAGRMDARPRGIVKELCTEGRKCGDNAWGFDEGDLLALIGGCGLFSYAKAGKDSPEQIIRAECAGNFSQSLLSLAKIFRQ